MLVIADTLPKKFIMNEMNSILNCLNWILITIQLCISLIYTKNVHPIFWNVASITTWVSPNESREFFPATDVCKLGLEWFLSFQLRENCGSLTFSGDPQSFIIGFLEMSFLLLLPRIMLHHIWIGLSIIEFLVFSHVHHFSSPK